MTPEPTLSSFFHAFADHDFIYLQVDSREIEQLLRLGLLTVTLNDELNGRAATLHIRLHTDRDDPPQVVCSNCGAHICPACGSREKAQTAQGGVS